ncbi:MAG TPA: response regulator [Gammaproteobacteria bacterium]
MSAEQGAVIAIVDDDESLRNSLLRLFRSAGYSVEGFESATDLLRSLPTRRPRCVILDLQLPDISGVEVLERFAKLADAPPVVVITGSDDACVRDQCVALGAQRYLRKPLDCDALLEAAREIVEP